LPGRNSSPQLDKDCVATYRYQPEKATPVYRCYSDLYPGPDDTSQVAKMFLTVAIKHLTGTKHQNDKKVIMKKVRLWAEAAMREVNRGKGWDEG